MSRVVPADPNLSPQLRRYLEDLNKAIDSNGTDLSALVIPQAATSEQALAGEATDVYLSPSTGAEMIAEQVPDPALVPTAWGRATISGTTATLAAGSGFASAERSLIGRVRFYFTTERADASYQAFPSHTSASGPRYGQIWEQTATYVEVRTSNAFGDATDADAVGVLILG